MGVKVLLVDDEQTLLETIAYNLEKEGFEVITAGDGESALALARDAQPDLVILDLMLPRVSGWEVCRALREDPEYRLNAPILMLTARGEESDRVMGLQLGADDYLLKPFGMRELVARVHALLRRVSRAAPADDQKAIKAGHLHLDVERHEVHVQDDGGELREVNLSLKEFELLRVLLTHNGQAVPRARLLHSVWGDDFFGDERTLDVHIRWLREKLEANPSKPQHILTVRGVGYKFRG